MPFIECKNQNECKDDSGDDFSIFLNAITGQPDQGSKSTANSLNDISRCAVCLGDD